MATTPDLSALYHPTKYAPPSHINQIALEDAQKTVEDIIIENDFLNEEINIFSSHAKSISKGHLNESDDGRRTSIDNLSESEDASSGGTSSYLQGSMKSSLRRRKSEAHLHQLSLDNKIEIASREIERLGEEIAQEEKERKRKEDKHKAAVEEAKTSLADAVQDDRALEKRVLEDGFNSRIEGLMAEKFYKFYEEKLKAKDALAEKLKLNIVSQKSEYKKLSSQLKQREEMGDGLKEIDFAQLKIENQKYMQRIEDKNKELLDLKMETGNSTNVLNFKIEELSYISDQSERTRKEIKDKEHSVKDLKNQIQSVIKEKEKASKKLDKLKDQHEEIKVPEIIDYVQQKAEHYELKNEVKNWMRKVEIAQNNCKSHKAKLTRRGIKPPKLRNTMPKESMDDQEENDGEYQENDFFTLDHKDGQPEEMNL